jgi:hypothetical protein
MLCGMLAYRGHHKQLPIPRFKTFAPFCHIVQSWSEMLSEMLFMHPM